MKRNVLYIVSLIVIAIPWLFLMEIIPVPYWRISTGTEVIIEAVMFAALLADVFFLRKELKQIKSADSEKNGGAHRNILRLLFVLSSLTLFLVGLILVLIAISFTL